MPKNILIFSDGTGQVGGIKPDQRLTNVYKMYRAMRPGPESPISYSEQVAFYDPGLGSGETQGITFKKVSNLLQQSIGEGIEDNVVDCYESILSLYEEGDRIMLFGFSRGAYTVRTLANVLSLCGIPRALSNGADLPKSGAILRQLAVEAVKKVYSHGTGKPRGEVPYFQQREEKGRRFREKYDSNHVHDQQVSNVIPEFIGVFDTVAALGNPAIKTAVRGFFGALIVAGGASWIFSWSITAKISISALFLVTLLGYLYTVARQIRYFEEDPQNPLQWYNPFHWRKIIQNTHRAYWNKENYDRYLDERVGFARHALSIDEWRADFPRVEWAYQAAVDKNDAKRPHWLKQIWFAGCHSDIGGSYPEVESRLSDIALEWMVNEVRECVPSIKIRSELLNTTCDSSGIQHEELYVIESVRKRWKLQPREVNIPRDGTNNLHPSVMERLSLSAVPHPGEMKPYRPIQLKDHPFAVKYY